GVRQPRAEPRESDPGQVQGHDLHRAADARPLSVHGRVQCSHGARRGGGAMRKAVALLVAVNVLSSAPLAHADPDDYVAVPAVEYGEREVELRIGSASATEEHRQSAASLAFGYGLTPWWFTEIYGKWHRSGATSFDAIEWENRFQLTEPGQYFADFGLLVEIERPRDHAEGYEFKIGPLIQKDFGPLQANFNVIVERHFHASESEQTELGYEWQLRYHYRPAFDFGAQGFGGVGTWS